MKSIFIQSFIILTVVLSGQIKKSLSDPIPPSSIDSIALDQKIGQMIMIGIGNTKEINENNPIVNSIKKGHVGGILLFEMNISTTNSEEKLTQLTTDLQSYSPTPLLISIDQEGGKVNRMKTKYGFPQSVSAKYLGTKNDLALTKKYADSTAYILNKTGVNLNFAPCVDIDLPSNPIIGKFERAYSENPEIICEQASQVVASHRAFNVKTSLKHFPGHGSSNADSHKGIADVSKTWTESELIPYQQMINTNSVDAILVAHVVNKQLDPEGNPATLSYPIVTELLREKMGFNGVLFTDDMQMHAITLHYGLREAVKKSILAGMDILVYSNNIPTKGQENVASDNLVKMIKDMVKNGEISEERIDESYKRIMAFKKNSTL